MFENHLFWRFFLWEDHIEIPIIKVISNAIRIAIDDFRICLFFNNSFFLEPLYLLLAFDQFSKVFLVVGGETSNYNIFFLIVLVSHQLFKFLPFFVVMKRNVLCYHSCQCVHHQSVSYYFVFARLNKVLCQCFCQN